MNDSFQVILNHEEFLKYKQLQKESETNNRLVRDLRRDNDNYKIRCEQLELTLRTHQLKIKELSKNSIRLSRRLLAEQEQHFATHDAFLAREKELLQKLLAFSTHQQTAATFLQNAKDSTSHLALENSALRQANQEHERTIEALTAQSHTLREECSSLKKDADIWRSRCSEAAGESKAAAEESLLLRAQLKELCLQAAAREDQMMQERQTNQQKMLLLIQQQQQQKKKSELSYLQALTQMQDRLNNALQQLSQKTEQLNKATQEIADKSEELKAKTIRISLLCGQNEKLAQQCDSYQTKQQAAILQLKKTRMAVSSFKEELFMQREEIRTAQLDFQRATEQCHVFLRKLQEQCKELAKPRQQQLHESVWMSAQVELEAILCQLRKDRIEEEQEVLKQQFNRIARRLTTQLNQSIVESFRKWLQRLSAP